MLDLYESLFLALIVASMLAFMAILALGTLSDGRARRAARAKLGAIVAPVLTAPAVPAV